MKPSLPRRTFLKTALRTVAGGGMAAAGVSLASRENPVREDHCDQTFICPKCGKNATCGLPHALNYRAHLARHSRPQGETLS